MFAQCAGRRKPAAREPRRKLPPTGARAARRGQGASDGGYAVKAFFDARQAARR
jgi:hypothetical protein